MTKKHLLLLLLIVALQPTTSLWAAPPNFVVIFIDDMGYGDIEPFGSKLNKPPHLNQMAAEGRRLTSFYVASPVCTPSRAALMTGCYPQRVGLQRGSGHIVLFPGDRHGLRPSEVTIAETLKAAGYATGCFGKWHLGDQPQFLPTSQGFDTYSFTLKDNSVHLGFVTLESADTISIRNAAGVAAELPTKQITKREKIPASSMPPGLVAGLTPEQLADLLVYLDSI